MRKRADLDSYLNLLKNASTPEETLSFSIAQTKALQKLTDSQLPDPSLWIVKMVQAAVSGGASEIRIHFGRRQVEIHFDTSITDSAKNILESAMSGDIPQAPALLHLVTGIRGSFVGEGKSFLIQSTGPEGKELVTMGPTGSHRYSDPEETSAQRKLSYVVLRPYRLQKFPRIMNAPVKRWVLGNASEHLALLTRCWTCPVPIKVDGRLLDTRYDSPLMAYNPTLPSGQQKRSARMLFPSCCFALGYLKPVSELTLPKLDGWPGEPDTTTVSVGQNKVRRADQVFLGGRFLELDWPHELTGGAVCLHFGHLFSSKIFFVQDGVVIDSVPFTLRNSKRRFLGLESRDRPNMAYTVVVPVSCSDAGVSHFSVSNLAKRRDEIIQSSFAALFDLVEATACHMNNFQYVPSNPTKAKTALGLTGLPLVAVTAGFGPMALAGACYQGLVMGGISKFAGHNFKKNWSQLFQNEMDYLEELMLDELEQPPVRSAAKKSLGDRLSGVFGKS
jgi:hypothetical protein